MADKRISDLPVLNGTELDAAVDVLAVADLSAAETKKITAEALISKALATASGEVLNGNVIIDGTVPGEKLEADSITSRELAPNSVQTVHIVDGVVTNDKLAGGITNDKLAAGIDGSKLQDSSVSSAKLIGGITNDQLDGGISGDKIADGQIETRHLADSSVDGQSKIKDRSIPAIKIEQNTLTAVEIAPNAISSSELADGAVDTNALQDDACSTPKYKDLSVTNEKLASGIDGGKLQAGTITNDLLAGDIDGSKLDNVPLSKLPEASQNTVLAGPKTAGTSTPTYRKLVAADLPVATDVEIGGVSVPSSGGLTVSGGAVGITNAASPGTFPVVTYDSHGLIQSGRNLMASDLPPASPGSIGGVKPGNGISISGDGTISQSVTGVIAGTYPKVVVDERGNVTEGQSLEASDIPNIEYNQINGRLNFDNLEGQVMSAQIADKAVGLQHLADYSITFIQETTPPISAYLFTGCMWFQESTAALNMWNGNSWMSIGQGRLSAENLRYCGLVDASTGLITDLTQFGVAEALEVGDAVPPPTDERTGVYFVIKEAGSNITQTPGTAYDPGDWILCSGTAGGWSRIDTMTGGGGGGGGATRLEDLTDVTFTALEDGQLLQYSAISGIWGNSSVLSGGTY